MTKLSNEELNNLLKGYMHIKGFSYERLVQALASEYKYDKTSENLAKKVRSGTLRAIDFIRILDIIGFDFKIVEK